MEKVYNAKEVCHELGITIYTLTNWYQYERKMIELGKKSKQFLPQPKRLPVVTGRPRIWTEHQLEELKKFQEDMPRGRGGKMGIVTNPKHRQKKQLDI